MKSCVSTFVFTFIAGAFWGMMSESAAQQTNLGTNAATTATSIVWTLSSGSAPIQISQVPVSQQATWVSIVQACGPYATAIVALVAAFVALLKGRVDARYTYASEILTFRLRQLQEFYAPALLHIAQSTVLYKKLLWTIKQERKDIQLDGFRLLDRIREFETDPKLQPLVRRILTIGKQLTDLISQKAGLIEGGITPIFIEYQAHYEILKAASEQELSKSQQEGWHEFGYFPRMLTREIREGYKVVLEHFDNYVSAGDKTIYKLLGKRNIEIGNKRRQLLETIYYYERHALSYAAKYDSLDMTACRDRFLTAIEQSKNDRPTDLDTGQPRLLDVGCGTGRDTLVFVRMGFPVTAVDPSPEMLVACNNKLKEAREDQGDEAVRRAAFASSATEMTIDELYFTNEFDGVWAAASLLHVPEDKLNQAIGRLLQTLKLHGVLYMSFKHGNGEQRHDARTFTYLSKRNLESTLERIPQSDLIEVWLTDAFGNRLTKSQQRFAWVLEYFNRYGERTWINILLKRSRV